MIASFGVCMLIGAASAARTPVEILIAVAMSGLLIALGGWISFVGSKGYTRLLEFGDDAVNVKWFRRRCQYASDQVAEAEFERRRPCEPEIRQSHGPLDRSLRTLSEL